MNTPKSRLAFEDTGTVTPEEFSAAWETGTPADVMASRFGLKLAAVYALRVRLFRGIIGEAAAVEFPAFLKVWRELSHPLPLAATFAGGPTVVDLDRRYLEEHVAVRCKPKTARTARSVFNRHFVPALGRLPLAAVERRREPVRDPAMANMIVETLTHMYALARG